MELSGDTVVALRYQWSCQGMLSGTRVPMKLSGDAVVELGYHLSYQGML